jgi:hypothetical protein
MRKPSVPTYCLHKPTGQAYMRLAGKVIYLGKYGSVESKQKYAALLAEQPTPEIRQFYSETADGRTVAELAALYLQHAERYYGEKSERLAAECQALHANEFPERPSDARKRMRF